MCCSRSCLVPRVGSSPAGKHPAARLLLQKTRSVRRRGSAAGGVSQADRAGVPILTEWPARLAAADLRYLSGLCYIACSFGRTPVSTVREPAEAAAAVLERHPSRG